MQKSAFLRLCVKRWRHLSIDAASPAQWAAWQTLSHSHLKGTTMLETEWGVLRRNSNFFSELFTFNFILLLCPEAGGWRLYFFCYLVSRILIFLRSEDSSWMTFLYFCSFDKRRVGAVINCEPITLLFPACYIALSSWHALWKDTQGLYVCFFSCFIFWILPKRSCRWWFLLKA